MLYLKIRQEIACYRIPTVGNVWATFPLPQPSTIFGMLRAITGYMSINYLNTRLAIAGSYQSVNNHIETMTLTSVKEIKINIVPIQLLLDVNLSIYIDSFSEAEQAIYENQLKVGRLGRSEDIVVDIVVERGVTTALVANREVISSNYSMLIPFSEGLEGQVFRMALDIDKDLLDQEIRKAIWSKFLYLSQESFVSQNFADKIEVCNGEPVIWLNSAQRI